MIVVGDRRELFRGVRREVVIVVMVRRLIPVVAGYNAVCLVVLRFGRRARDT